MLVLAIETAVQPGSVCLYETQSRQSWQHDLPSMASSTASFIAHIRAQLREARQQPNDVQLAVASRGPGSFTGLRIGIVAVKAFAYATKCEVLAVDTLAIIASQVSQHGSIVCALDAHRGQGDWPALNLKIRRHL